MPKPSRNVKKQAKKHPARRAKPVASKSSTNTLVKRASRPAKVPQALVKYQNALLRPFAAEAFGAQVPDMFSYPTATGHTRGIITLNVNGSGVANLLFMPNPFASVVDTASFISSSSMTAFANSVSVYSAVTLANMSALYSRYRLVGGGIRIKNLMPLLSAAGRVVVATIPMAGNYPGPNVLAGTAIIVTDALRLAIGTTTISANLLELTSAREYTAQEISKNDMVVNFRPCGGSAFNFHDSVDNNEYNGSYNAVGQGVVNYNNNVFPGSLVDSTGVCDMSGWDAIAIYCSGFPASQTNALEIEYIYHFEGVPIQTSGTGIMAPDAGSPSPVHPNQLNQVLAASGELPRVCLETETFASRLTNYINSDSFWSTAGDLAGIGLSALLL